jgi:hypothetical protein
MRETTLYSCDDNGENDSESTEIVEMNRVEWTLVEFIVPVLFVFCERCVGIRGFVGSVRLAFPVFSHSSTPI